MTDHQFDEATWREQLRQNRAEKDEFLTDDPRSPISPAERESFDGLDYFDPDPDYRVTATAEVHEDPIAVEMTVTNGDPTRFQRVVTFEFDLPADSSGDGSADDSGDSAESDSVTETLHGFRPENDDSLFVPFRDKTTGQETYRGGRYMDLHPEGDLRDGATVTLDFNLAYTPFCAFSDSFACPLPPEENWLQTTVPAGERDPPVDE